MKVLLSRLCLLFLLLSSSRSYAATSLSLDDAIQTALKKRVEIIIADQDIARASYTLDEAASELYPRLDFIGKSVYTKTTQTFEPVKISFELLGQEQTISPTKDVPQYQSTMSLRATQKLFTGGRIVGKMKGARERIGQSELMKETHKREITLAVIKAYWELKRADMLLDIEKEKEKHSAIILETAKARFEKGNISGLEMEKSEVDYINSKGDLLHVATVRKIAETGMLREMGLLGTVNSPGFVLRDEPTGAIPHSVAGAVDCEVEHAMQSRPEIREILKRIAADEADAKVAKSDYYPQLGLVGEYNWVGWHKDSLDGSLRELKRDNWTVMLKLDFNFFEGFATATRVNKARAEARVSQLEMDKERQIIEADIKKAVDNMAGISERLSIQFRNLSLAEKNFEAAKKQFELGVMTINQVAEYNMSLADTRKRYVDALLDLEIAKAEYHWAAGEEQS